MPRPLAVPEPRRRSENSGGLFDLKAAGFVDPILVASNDGVGTKVKIAIETGLHDTIGIDLVAMCANDVVVQGAQPLFFLDYFASGALDVEVASRVVARHRRGLQTGGCRADRRRDGGNAGHLCARRLRLGRLLRRRGRAWHSLAEGYDRSQRHRHRHCIVGRAFQRLFPRPENSARQRPEMVGSGPIPTRQIRGGSSSRTDTDLCRVALKAHRTGVLKALAHITGGGLHGNVPRVLPSDLAAIIDLGAIDYAAVFRWLAEAGRVPESEMLRTFNCGNRTRSGCRARARSRDHSSLRAQRRKGLFNRRYRKG